MPATEAGTGAHTSDGNGGRCILSTEAGAGAGRWGWGWWLILTVGRRERTSESKCDLRNLV